MIVKWRWDTAGKRQNAHTSVVGEHLPQMPMPGMTHLFVRPKRSLWAGRGALGVPGWGV